jgi:D-glycero-alpha-D-manno-heptose 1-phosphate guanylyltransferase
MGGQNDFPNTDVLILSGGAGTRLRSIVSDRSKVIAEVGGRPFLDIILEDLFKWRFKKICLGVGYMADQIINRYKDDPRISFSLENEMLGTGGAVKNALSLLTSKYILVMNGDSFCEVDYGCLFNFHSKNNSLLSIVLTKSSGRTDVGHVSINEFDQITGFQEKTSVSEEERFTNAGIYLMDRRAMKFMPAQKVFSIERDFFPRMIGNRCFGFVVGGEVMDIGTPERYQEIDEYFRMRFLK